MADDEVKRAMLSMSDYDNYSEHDDSFTMNNIVLDFGECGFRCIRSSFFLFNLFFWTAGLTIVLLGVWLNITTKDAAIDYAAMSGINIYIQSPSYLIIVGVVTLFLTFMGCCGVRMSSICLLASYASLLCAIVACQLAAIGLTYIYKDKVETNLKNGFKVSLDHYSEPGNEKLSTVLDSLQTSFQCCGGKDYTDWLETKWGRSNVNSVPRTCCILPYTDTCNKNIPATTDMIYREGCFVHLKKYLLENLHVINGVAIWIVVMEALGILFSIIFIFKIRKERRVVRGEETYYEMAERYCKDE